VRRGWIARVPCPVQRPKLVVLTPGRDVAEEDFLRVLKVARGVWDRRCEAILLLARDAGMRRSDMLILRGADIDLEGGWITPRVRSERDAPKSRRARRVPILTSRLRRALEGMPLAPDELVLQLSESGIQHMASRAWEEVFPGEGAPLHHLRHTFATRALEAGFTLPTVQAWMGHTSPTTTAIYVHPDPSTMPQGAREAFEGATQRQPGGPDSRSTTRKSL
jgi:integrase